MQNDLVPPGLTYLADNILTRQNILGVTKEQGARWAKNWNFLAQIRSFLPAAAISTPHNWKC